MEKKSKLYWGVQFLGWTIYFLFSLLLLYSGEEINFTGRLLTFAFVSILTSILISHGIRFVIIKQSLIVKPVFILISTTLVLVTVGAIILEAVQFSFEILVNADYLVSTTEAEEEVFKWSEFLFAVFRSMILFLLWSGFYFAFIISEKSHAQEILNLKWEASKNEIELKNLRAQLDPHFLFNSLNSVRALIGMNPELAKSSVTHLSNLLRRSIQMARARVVPLSEELELVQIYLELEQIRFEERLSFEFKISPDSYTCEIPPVMLQTIVENSIKHGISKEVNGGKILIESTFEDNTLVIKVINSGSLKLESNENGIGISNTKKRLAILFGAKGHFKIEQNGEFVVSTITITYK